MPSPQSAEKSLQQIRDHVLGQGGTGIAIGPVSADPTASAITAANGSAQDIFDARVVRRFLVIENTSGGELWVRMGADASAAAPSFRIPAGGVLTFEPPGLVPIGRVSLYGSDGLTFTAWEA